MNSPSGDEGAFDKDEGLAYKSAAKGVPTIISPNPSLQKSKIPLSVTPLQPSNLPDQAFSWSRGHADF